MAISLRIFKTKKRNDSFVSHSLLGGELEDSVQNEVLLILIGLILNIDLVLIGLILNVDLVLIGLLRDLEVDLVLIRLVRDLIDLVLISLIGLILNDDFLLLDIDEIGLNGDGLVEGLLAVLSTEVVLLVASVEEAEGAGSLVQALSLLDFALSQALEDLCTSAVGGIASRNIGKASSVVASRASSVGGIAFAAVGRVALARNHRTSFVASGKYSSLGRVASPRIHRARTVSGIASGKSAS